MDWEKVQKTLKKRNYDTFGGIIEDLRLIFVNALKYNARLAGTDTVSGRAYDSAKIMSVKLEVAINKLMVTVSDRVERERIDHNNAEREIEAAERVEAERIRAQWKNDASAAAADEGGENPDSKELPKVEGSLRVRVSNRRVNHRQSDTDFELPFFEQEEYEGQHEQSYVEVIKQQKATFERQRTELKTMRQSTRGIGWAVHNRILQSQLAMQWIADEQARLGIAATGDAGAANKSTASESSGTLPSASEVATQLEKKDRPPVQMKLLKTKKKKDSGKNKPVAMDWGDDDDDDE